MRKNNTWNDNNNIAICGYIYAKTACTPFIYTKIWKGLCKSHDSIFLLCDLVALSSMVAVLAPCTVSGVIKRKQLADMIT